MEIKIHGSDNGIVVYTSDSDLRLKVITDGETVWLTIEQMAIVFGRDKAVIGKHVRNVFSEGELPVRGLRQIVPKASEAGGRPVAI